MRVKWWVVGAVLGTIWGAMPAAAETPYVFQQGLLERAADGSALTSVESQTTMGTRELRPLGGRGVDQGLRVRHSLLENTSLEAYGGIVWLADSPDLRPGSIGVEVVQRVVTQKQLGVDVQVAAGAYRDMGGVFVPKARAIVGRTWGRIHAQASGQLEVPIASHRDAVDLIIGAAASYQLGSVTSLGLEVLGEDLEGIWDAEEAEGGARLLAGPSFHTAWNRLHVHAHAGITETWPVPGQAPLTGAMGRVNVGWRF